MAGRHKPLPLTSHRSTGRRCQRGHLAAVLPTGISRRGDKTIAGLIYKELWHDPKTCEWTRKSPHIGWLWIKLISFVEDHHSAGVVTVLQALTVATLNNIPPSAVNQLVEAKGLDVVPGGYRIHNYARRGKLTRARSVAGKKGYRAMVESLPGNLPSSPPDTVAMKESLAGQKNFASANTGVGVGVVQELFQTWKGAAGKPTARLTDKRDAAIKRALKKFEPDEVRDALLGWQNDPWEARARNNDPILLLRDEGQVEKFRDLQRDGPPSAALFKAGGTVARAQARAKAFEGLAVVLEDEAPPQLEEGA